MLLSLGITSSISSADFTRMLDLAEKNKFECLWIGDDINRPSDVFVQASVALLRTSVKVGIGITSIYVRNVSNLARAAVSLYEIGNSNFRLGIGVGGLQILARMGISTKKPLSAMREATSLLRKIWNGERVTIESDTFHLKDYYVSYGLGQKIPIYFGVRGPKMLELAGEVADGVILSGPKTYLKRAIHTIRKGSKKSNRREEEIRIVVWLPTVLGAGRENLELAKRVVAVVLADMPATVLRMSRVNPEVVKDVREAFALEGIESATAQVTDEIVDDMIFHGSAHELCDSFLTLEDYGVNEVVFGPPYGAHRKLAVSEIATAWSNAR